MEALLLLIGEFLIAPLVAALSLTGQLIAAICGSIVEASLWLFGKRSVRHPAADSPKFLESLSRLSRLFMKILLGLMALSAGILLLLNFVFLERVARRLADRVESRSGIAIHYEAFDGNLFLGRFNVSGFQIQSESEETMQFDLRAEETLIDLSVWDLLTGRRTVDRLSVIGLEGRFTRLNVPPQSKGRPPAKQRFLINLLTVSDSTVLIEDRSAAEPVSYFAQIERIVAKPLRSEYLWFDLLFRSNMELTLGERTEVQVENSESAGRRHTLWAVTAADATVLSSLIGGPFRHFTQGQIDIRVEDSWTLHENAEIELSGTMRLQDAVAEVPANTPPLLRAPAAVFSRYVNEKDEPWELSFMLKLRESQFAGAASLDARKIWAETTETFLTESLGLDRVQSEKVKEAARGAAERFNRFLEKRAKDSETP